MDKTILGILIGSLTTLVGVGLTSLFNYKTKMRELKHNEHLKELELKDREKERKFKIEEKMIEKSIQAHVEAYGKIMGIFELVNRYYTADGTLNFSNQKEKDELSKYLDELMDWNRSIGLFLEKEIHKQIHLAGNIGYRALRQNLKPPPPKLDPWNQFYRTIQGLKTTLEQILKEYNPLYDLNVKFPKIEDLFSQV